VSVQGLDSWYLYKVFVGLGQDDVSTCIAIFGRYLGEQDVRGRSFDVGSPRLLLFPGLRKGTEGDLSSKESNMNCNCKVALAPIVDQFVNKTMYSVH